MKKYIQLLVIVLFVVGSGLSFYFYTQWQKAIEAIKAEPTNEIAMIVEIISQSMDLPEGETPTLATVSDKEKLKDQQFFARAENGDKVLIYNKSSKAILYRPSTKRVIEVASIYVDDARNLTTQSDAATSLNINNERAEKNTSTIRLAFFNGSGVPEKHALLADIIKKEFINAVTVIVANTTTAYTGILVVDVSGKMNIEATMIADVLGGKIGTLPETEPKPDADIAIIIGK